MKDKKNLILIAICVMLIVGLVIYTIIDDDVQDPSENYVSRAVVAKNVSLLFHSVDECMNQQENHFDKSVDEWYVPYMNKMYNDGYYTEKIIDGGCHSYYGMYGAQAGDGIPTITNIEQIRITADEIEKILGN